MTALTGDSSDTYSTFALVRRLLVSEALTHWPRYAVAFTLMGSPPPARRSVPISSAR